MKKTSLIIIAVLLAATTLFSCACSDNSVESETGEERTGTHDVTKAPAEDSGIDTLIEDTAIATEEQTGTELPEATEAVTVSVTTPVTAPVTAPVTTPVTKPVTNPVVTEKKDEPVEDKDLVVDAVNIVKDPAPTTAIISDPIRKQHNIRFPKLNINTPNASRFNSKLYGSDALEVCNDVTSGKDIRGCVYEVSYEYKVYNGCVGIFIDFENNIPASCGSFSYTAFYYDVENDKELSFDEYLARLGTTNKALMEKVKQTKEYKESYWEGTPLHNEAPGAYLMKTALCFGLKTTDFSRIANLLAAVCCKKFALLRSGQGIFLGNYQHKSGEDDKEAEVKCGKESYVIAALTGVMLYVFAECYQAGK